MSKEQVLCDLILLSWNQLDVTKQCLESLFRTLRIPSRLLIVDNGSERPVREYLASVKPAGVVREVELLQNDRNEGFPRGMNRGIAASRAPYVCLLNNDLLFTEGWLREMIWIAESNPAIGVVNPASSTFGSLPEKGMSLDEYGVSMRQNQGIYTEVGMCIGFCMLIKRDLINKIGGLTEEVDRIFFEDEDYCMRTQQAGFMNVVAEGAYVFHAEHKTVKKMPERETLFSKNRDWCEKRWGKRLRIAWPHLEKLEPGHESTRALMTRLVSWVRRRNHVYLYTPSPSRPDFRELCRSVSIVPHADVHWIPISPAFAHWSAGGWILKRRKKPFDLIASPDERWGKTMEKLRWLHGASVVPQNDEEKLLREWQIKSRSR